MKHEKFWATFPAGICVIFAGCTPGGQRPDLFPPTVASVWHRTAVQEMAVSDSPDPVPRTSVNRLQTAAYDGPGKLEARVYDLDSSAVALGLVQRWRPSADTVFFYRDRYFVVIKWQNADRKALQAFVRELEERLGGPRRPS